MRLILTLVFLFYFMPSMVVASDDETTLRHFKTVLWPQAYRTQDTDLLNRLLDDSFQMIDAAGDRSTKQQELEYIRNHQWNPGNFEYQIQRLEIYQDRFAVIDGKGVTDTYSYISSNYLIKKDGQWRAIASHVSGYQEKSAD